MSICFIEIKKNLLIKKNNSGQILEEFKNFDLNP